MQGVSCIDLFCGVGGLTHGLLKEGINVNAGVDVDANCRYPFEVNNQTTFLQSDVAEISSKDLASYFTPGNFRVLAGCAPCQPFSTYSQRYDLAGDPRWTLLKAFADHVMVIQPDVVTMENVPSLIKHEVFRDFTASLVSVGYSVTSQVVDCSEYGVAQTRQRVVLLASRHGDIQLVQGARKKRSVRDVISKLPRLAAGEGSKRDRIHVAASLSDLNRERIQASRPGGTWREWPEVLQLDCHKKKTGKTYPGVYGRMSWDEPAPTITTQCFGFGNGRFGHPEQDRAISLREAAMLQSFPSGYKFLKRGEEVQFKTIGRMIGNAVPVNLGRAIGKSIVMHLETKSAPKQRRSRVKSQ